MRIPVSCLFMLGLLSLLLPTSAGYAQQRNRQVDVVLCLDVSNSMDGLIASAKAKLWDIVNDLAKARPLPHLRVALYSYGSDRYDAKSGWVRKECDLTDDLDTVYGKLYELQTRGGTEYVARVCRDALRDLQWSEDKNALKVIFVCGNEPADQDRQVSLQEVAELAKKLDVFINPIYCGSPNHRDALSWKNFAGMGVGRFMSIDQDAAVRRVQIKTPFDEELIKLGEQLNKTYLAYGKAEERASKEALQRQQDRNAAAAAPEAAIARNAAKASGLYRNESWDLVDRLKNDKSFDLSKLKESELCEDLQKLTPEQRLAFVQKKLEERETLNRRIRELNTQRQKLVDAELKKLAGEASKALDEAMRQTIREQAAQRGFEIGE